MPKPTVTTSRTTPTGKNRPSNPALTLTRPAKPAPTKPSGTTLFNRRPVADATPSLADAVRTGKTAPSSPTKPRPSRPAKASVTAPVKTRVKTPAAAPTANDGRAARLNSGNNVGSRDDRIAALKETKATLKTEETQIEGQIDNLEDEIEGDETATTVVKTGVGILSAPVGAIAGLFGKSNPVSDAAGAVTENLLGLEGDRNDLKAQERELESQQAEIEREIKKLETEQVLNFLADTAHVVDMDDKVVDFIEGGKTRVGDLDVRLNVEDETGTGADGTYDSGTQAITVDSEILSEAREHMEDLRRTGIVDGDGNIVDAQGFDRSSAGDAAIKSVSLIAVHELNHATQDSQGSFSRAFESAESIINNAKASIGAGTTLEAAGNILSAAAAQGEAVRSEAIEVDSYRLQEQNDLRSGAVKKAFITIDEQGHALPEGQQLANVLAYQEGRALVHGPSAGYVRESDGGKPENHDHDGDGATDGDHTHDQVAPGFRAPGEEADGFRAPGFRAPGEEADGFRAPGFRAPGFEADGFRAPGFRAPGYEADGFRAPGFRAPGETVD